MRNWAIAVIVTASLVAAGALGRATARGPDDPGVDCSTHHGYEKVMFATLSAEDVSHELALARLEADPASGGPLGSPVVARGVRLLCPTLSSAIYQRTRHARPRNLPELLRKFVGIYTPPLGLVSPTPAAAEDDGITDDTTVGEVIDQAERVEKTWKEAGWIAGLLALVHFLIRLTKLSVIGDALKRNNAQWVRPILAVVAAAIGAVIANLAGDVAVPWAILAGVVAAVGSPGFEEVLKAFKALGSQREREKLQAKEAAAAAVP